MAETKKMKIGLSNSDKNQMKNEIEGRLNESFNLKSKEIDVKLKNQDDTIKGLGKLHPSGTATESEIMAFTSDKGIYIGTDTGNWYYWSVNSNIYVSGGAYQATQVPDESITPEKTTFFDITEPINKYNENSTLNRSNYMIQGSGDYISLSGSSVSHPIKIKPNTTYSFNNNSNYYGQNSLIVRECQEDGTLVGNSGFLATSHGSYCSFTNDHVERYVCVNVRAQNKNTFMFVEGSSFPETYQAYFDIKKKIGIEYLPDEQLNNPLYQKKLAVIGDSICYGAGSTGGYAKIIGENNDMTISNTAISGATIVSGDSSRFRICSNIQNMPSNYDYYIFEGGVNDYSLGVSLGTITSDYTSTFDTTTLCGAFESICKELQTRFVGKKYGYIFVHNVFNYNDAWQNSWIPAMKQILSKWGIPYLDLYSECPQLRNIDALRVYTSDNDGWHPTEEGYKLFYVPKITAWMKTL